MNPSPIEPSVLSEHLVPEDAAINATAPEAEQAPASEAKKVAQAAAVQAMLEKLFELHPQLFGARFLPLKLGIYQDLLAAHPELDGSTLKLALGRHTRSTPYLQCVAAGQQRYDLVGQPVSPLAPEHVLMAVVDLHRRRQSRTKEDLRPRLFKALTAAFQKSGLSGTAYRSLLTIADPQIATLLDEVVETSVQKEAKQQALLRAYQASGKPVDEFAAMYGLSPRDVMGAFKASLVQA
jgi:ProP effector